MGVIDRDKNLTTLYYHPDNKNVKPYLAIMTTLKTKIRSIDLSQAKLTSLQWSKLATFLSVDADNLIHKEHPYIKQTFGNPSVKLADHDALRILQKHPEVLLNPIVLSGTKAIIAEHPNDISRL
jgi:arsenate reductase-like glutaredoxin family protein